MPFFLCAICTRSFNKKILHKIVGTNYCKSSARIVAWDDAVLEMQAKKVRPKNGLLWGEPKVVWFKWKCRGVPTTVKKHNQYPTEYSVKDKKGGWHVQCDCIVLITVKKTKGWSQAEIDVESNCVDLFGLDKSQSKNDPPSPPPRRRRKRRSEERHEVDDEDEDEDEDGGV